MKNVLCADIGTSSLKAAVISEDGSVLAYSRRKFLLKSTKYASKEWFPSLVNACQEMFANNPDVKVNAICISGNGPTLTASTGETLLWNEDADESISYSGKSLFIPRLLTFKNRMPDIWNSAETIFSSTEYMIYLLTESKVTIIPENRFVDFWWNRDELLKSGFTEADCKKLPQFYFSGSMAGRLTRKAESFFSFENNGITEGTPVYCGAPDFVCALAGTATLNPGVLCDRAGSSEGINLCTPSPIFSDKIRTMPSVVPGLWNAAVLYKESGSKYSAFKKKVEREAGHEFEHNDLVHKCLTADGSDPTYSDGKYLLTQIALDVRNAIDILKDASKNASFDFPKEITITGGQAANDEWNQLKANITGLTIKVPLCHDAELTGCAVFAFTGMKVFENITQASMTLSKAAKVFTPQDEQKAGI
ncbi:MAG: hypothetical protein J6O39_01145 [Treponema sp.]|nr:hypothetical protein [Treponema sp.]